MFDFIKTIQTPQRNDEERIDRQDLTQRVKQTRFFDISEFERELFVLSETEGREHQQHSNNINAYDLIGCIRAALFKYFKYPVKSFADRWLPVRMRTTIGQAIHRFIQENTKQFTETEVYIKVPSRRFLGKADALINDNVLVEIKSCTYADYQKIINTRKPKSKHFYQTLVYKYFLDNYCNEIKQCFEKGDVPPNANPPRLDKYNIEWIQFIYVAHDVISADADSLSEALYMVSKIKKSLNSRDNKFFFITSLVIDVREDNIKQQLSYIVDRIEEYNRYIDANKIPPIDHRFVDTSMCYFCIYRDICQSI